MIVKAYYRNMVDGLPALTIEYDNGGVFQFSHFDVKTFLIENGYIPAPFYDESIIKPPIEIVDRGKIELNIDGQLIQGSLSYTRDKDILKLVNRYIDDIESKRYVEGTSIISELN